jgi:hypothetical protein
MDIKALSSSEMVLGCQDSRGGVNISRKRHGVTLYVRTCLPCVALADIKHVYGRTNIHDLIIVRQVLPTHLMQRNRHGSDYSYSNYILKICSVISHLTDTRQANNSGLFLTYVGTLLNFWTSSVAWY